MKLAIGFFDGVHLGHRRILAQADAALTFSEHPLAVLAPARAPALLMTGPERLAAIAAVLGSSRVRALPFTPELAAEEPAEFVRRLRRDYPDLDTVFCGPNWTFGAGGKGTADFLRAEGLAVETVPFEMQGGAPISSTRVRAALTAGDLAAATAMLGRPYAITGAVAAGKGLGRKLGFPTINVRPANPDLRRLLPHGVYVVETAAGRGLANWGVAPTMGERAWPEPVLEVHLVDRPEDGARPSVGGDWCVSFTRYLRPERRMDTLEELQRQIRRDLADALAR